MENIKAALN